MALIQFHGRKRKDKRMEGSQNAIDIIIMGLLVAAPLSGIFVLMKINASPAPYAGMGLAGLFIGISSFFFISFAVRYRGKGFGQ